MERFDSMKRASRNLLGAGMFAMAMIAVAARPAAAEICGAQEDGILCGSVVSGSNPVAGARIEIRDSNNTGLFGFAETNDTGAYVFLIGQNFTLGPGTYTLCVVDDMGGCGDTEKLYVSLAPDGTTLVATDTSGAPTSTVRIDFSITPPPPPPSGPGTGTPGYWKNHPEAWPVTSIKIGKQTYTREQAIGFMGKVGGDKSVTIFSSLLSAKLNVMIGNDESCLNGAIDAADSWFSTYVPNGMPGKIAGASVAWSGAGQGDAIHQVMDNYNNGLLSCAHHRD